MKVYSFQVQDKDPECLTFGCVAECFEQAMLKVEKAGYSSVLLMEAGELSGFELDEVVDLDILANPFLGPEWLPIIDALAPRITRDGVGRRWGLNVVTAPYNWGYNEPGGEIEFLQAINEGDGSLHLELGTKDITTSGNQKALDYLAFSGWTEPKDGLPLHFKVLEPGWNLKYALQVALQAMTTVFNVTAQDIFKPEGLMIRGALDEDLFDWGVWNGPFDIQGWAFALKGFHELSLTEPDEETKARVRKRAFPRNDAE